MRRPPAIRGPTMNDMTTCRVGFTVVSAPPGFRLWIVDQTVREGRPDEAIVAGLFIVPAIGWRSAEFSGAAQLGDEGDVEPPDHLLNVEAHDGDEIQYLVARRRYSGQGDFGEWISSLWVAGDAEDAERLRERWQQLFDDVHRERQGKAARSEGRNV